MSLTTIHAWTTGKYQTLCGITGMRQTALFRRYTSMAVNCEECLEVLHEHGYNEHKHEMLDYEYSEDPNAVDALRGWTRDLEIEEVIEEDEIIEEFDETGLEELEAIDPEEFEEIDFEELFGEPDPEEEAAVAEALNALPNEPLTSFQAFIPGPFSPPTFAELPSDVIVIDEDTKTIYVSEGAEDQLVDSNGYEVVNAATIEAQATPEEVEEALAEEIEIIKLGSDDTPATDEDIDAATEVITEKTEPAPKPKQTRSNPKKMAAKLAEKAKRNENKA